MSDTRSHPMLEALDDAAGLWRDDELAAIFRHQLAARLEPELAQWNADLLRKLRGDPAAAGRLSECIGQILHSAAPPVEVLAAIKEIGKALGRGAAAGVPADIGKALYFLAIAKSKLCHGQASSGLDDDALARGLKWAAGRDWVDEESRKMLEEVTSSTVG